MEEEHEFPVVEIKKEINNLIWRYAHGKTTLLQAEDMACSIYSILVKNEKEVK